MPLLLMESDGVTNCSQKLLHVARTVGIFCCSCCCRRDRSRRTRFRCGWPLRFTVLI